MRIQLVFLFAMLSISVLSAQKEFEYKGIDSTRVIPRGRGQFFTHRFVLVDDYHFVQFAVHPEKDLRRLKAPDPAKVGETWLIRHEDTVIKGSLRKGAIYIVKPYESGEAAKLDVAKFKKIGFECWYNPELTGLRISLLGYCRVGAAKDL